MVKSSFAGIENFSLKGAIRDIKHFVTRIDRQGLEGLPSLISSIPPVAQLIGFATAVAGFGVLAQTGVLTPFIDAINNVISKWSLYKSYCKMLSN